MQKSYLFLYLLIFTSVLSSCNNKEITKSNISNKKTIAITKAHGSNDYLQYKKWIHNYDSTIIIYDLYKLSLDSAKSVLNIVDGLIISGGPDENPHLYGEDSMAYLCQSPDNYRDSLEYLSIKTAYNKNLPILGVCRGLQILNVYFGGSLINDIPTQIDTTVKHNSATGKTNHIINLYNNGYLYKLVNKDSIIVNSSHHQAIKVLSNNFIVNARSTDGIIESISLKEEVEFHNFFLGVQFHPECMNNTLISDVIAKEFIKSINK